LQYLSYNSAVQESERQAGIQEVSEEETARTAAGLSLPSASALRADAEFVARFWNHVDREEKTAADCWEWTGYREEKGYGRFRIKNRVCAAHRVSFMLEKGRWPSPSLMILHSCDNPACVNPAHLREGTAQENQDDIDARGRRRIRNGSDHWRGGRPSDAILRGGSRLSEYDVREIRQKAREADLNTLAMDFGVTPSVVRDTAERRTFEWVAGEQQQ
jgi:hypothetical protein